MKSSKELKNFVEIIILMKLWSVKSGFFVMNTKKGKKVRYKAQRPRLEEILLLRIK